jgi:hypothetical protein
MVAAAVASASGDRACVSFPAEAGYYVGDELPGSFFRSTVTSDKNGDAWLAWAPWPGVTMSWSHTYCIATVAAITITGNTEARDLSWTLSQSAPDSWWAIERRSNTDGFADVARVKSDGGTQMMWTDTSKVYAPFIYRIRRENIDKQYEYLSDSVVWDYPTSISLSLRSAISGDHGIELEWFGPGAGNLDASVRRRTDSSLWLYVGRAEPKGGDRLAYVDSSVSPGGRYAYRLAYTEDGIERFTSETWVDVARAAFSLGGFSPNPSAGFAAISFSLPAPGDAQVEVLDISGRRLTRQRLRGLATGDHVVDLRKALPPGLYIIRLQFGGQELVARGVVVR